MIQDGLWDAYGDVHMGDCAELCARDKGITREDQDAHAAESYRRARAAQAEGKFVAEIVAGRGAPAQGAAEASWPPTSRPSKGDPDKLASLRPAFQKEGTVTAGNASSLSDGAAAVVLASAAAAKALALKPLARIVGSATHSQAPEWFTTAPAGAIEQLCKKIGWSKEEVDLWEVNEAFSVVSVVNNRLLGIDPGRVNVWGGAVALGHPIGASGARVLVHAAGGAGRPGQETRRRLAVHRRRRGHRHGDRAPGHERHRADGRGRRRPDGPGHRPGGGPGRPARWCWPTPPSSLAEKGRAAIAAQLGKLVEKGKLPAAERDALLGRIKAGGELADLADVDFAIEAASESPAVKQQIFADLDRACRPGVILATNTSSIGITGLAARTKRPDRVIGMHFMNPVPVMKLVEIIRGLPTSDETYETTRALAVSFGKETVVSRDVPGFIVNRVLMPLINEAIFVLYENIATAEDIDKAIHLGLNHPMGPLALADLIGLDTTLAILEVMHRELGEPQVPPVHAAATVRGGRLAGPQGRPRVLPVLIRVWAPKQARESRFRVCPGWRPGSAGRDTSASAYMGCPCPGPADTSRRHSSPPVRPRRRDSPRRWCTGACRCGGRSLRDRRAPRRRPRVRRPLVERSRTSGPPGTPRSAGRSCRAPPGSSSGRCPRRNRRAECRRGQRSCRHHRTAAGTRPAACGLSRTAS